MNPFIRFYEAPVESLAGIAYVLILIGILTLTWWALSRNLLYLREEWRNGWLVLVPLTYTVRVAATLGLLAVDALLIGGIIYVITP
ncbi:hypothetical protein OSG_eHP14_00015 [environmental Halophage eHP-14]|nr:hypothetical protein OSG_eHP14_00015 [environmental Halophage eHP-14]